MSTIKKIAFLQFLFFGLFCTAFSQNKEIPNEIIVSLGTGDSKVLSNYFNQNVELVVLENDNVYSKAQAQQIVNNFFKNFKPVAENAFTILHDGGKEGAKYVIGNLKTNNGNFRIYFLLKKNNGKDYIHQLRIEKK